MTGRDDDIIIYFDDLLHSCSERVRLRLRHDARSTDDTIVLIILSVDNKCFFHVFKQSVREFTNLDDGSNNNDVGTVGE